jgi:hypothetical protein
VAEDTREDEIIFVRPKLALPRRASVSATAGASGTDRTLPLFGVASRPPA